MLIILRIRLSRNELVRNDVESASYDELGEHKNSGVDVNDNLYPIKIWNDVD